MSYHVNLPNTSTDRPPAPTGSGGWGNEELIAYYGTCWSSSIPMEWPVSKTASTCPGCGAPREGRTCGYCGHEHVKPPQHPPFQIIGRTLADAPSGESYYEREMAKCLALSVLAGLAIFLLSKLSQ